MKLQEFVGRQVFPIHRLDFEVSGIVLFALERDSHRVSQTWFEKGTITKHYWARTIAGSSPPPREWVKWEAKILRGKRRAYISPHGKPSLTEARVVKTDDEEKVWHWELIPRTGRSHQLRFDLARFGTPILSDVLYGGPALAEGHIALRAKRLDLSRIPEIERAGLPITLAVD